MESSCKPTSKASLSVSDRDVVKQLRYCREKSFIIRTEFFKNADTNLDANYSKQTLDAVLPCLSGCVSEGWHDRTVRYDDLHLGTTGGGEDGVIFNRTAEKKNQFYLDQTRKKWRYLRSGGQRNKNCNTINDCITTQ